MSERGSWCTPSWLTALLPFVELDPCSNPRSTVRSARRYSLEAGQDGLTLPWDCSVYCNVPYDDVAPWALKLLKQDAIHPAAFLVNCDPSTAWWSLLTARLDCALMFRRRIQFEPPAGVVPSTNSKPQALLMNRAYWLDCEDALFEYGTLWVCSSLSYRSAYRTKSVDAEILDHQQPIADGDANA